jgi:hypothetical protein
MNESGWTGPQSLAIASMHWINSTDVVVDSPCEAVNGGDEDHGDSDDDARNSEADCNPLEGLFSINTRIHLSQPPAVGLKVFWARL